MPNRSALIRSALEKEELEAVYKRLSRVATGREPIKASELEALKLFLSLHDPYAANVIKPPSKQTLIDVDKSGDDVDLSSMPTGSVFRLLRDEIKAKEKSPILEED